MMRVIARHVYAFVIATTHFACDSTTTSRSVATVNTIRSEARGDEKIRIQLEIQQFGMHFKKVMSSFVHKLTRVLVRRLYKIFYKFVHETLARLHILQHDTHSTHVVRDHILLTLFAQ